MSRDGSGYLFAQRWPLSILFYGVGDLVTTGIGLGPGGLVEVNPVAVSLGAQFGFPALVALKLGTLGACYAIWRVVPRPHRDGIPLGLVSLGVLVTAWNIHVLTVALLG